VTLTFGFYVESVEFTADVIAGRASLGGSESACLGLARALKARGHKVTIFSAKLGKDAPVEDHAGVRWRPVTALAREQILCDFDVFVALRMPGVLNHVDAKFNVLWNQDLMYGEPMKLHTMGLAWAYDAVAYVSEFHRHQWEAIAHELTDVGYVTRNGFDPALVPDPKTVTKAPHRVIHISRPERGLEPLLTMWPKVRAAIPDAELHLCRYSSMYDKDGWGKVCADFDTAAQQVNDEVGGIVWLGELGKADLYRAIAEAAVMWYPGVVDFAETSCISAIESQANGTPFVGSYKGALPETVPAGVLIKGDAVKDEAYHEQSVAAVVDLLRGCERNTFGYRKTVQAGRDHVFPRYTYAAIAEEWEAWLLGAFQSRYETHKIGVLRRLLNDDDHVGAKVLAYEIAGNSPDITPHVQEAEAAEDFCDYVIAGKDHTAETYGEFAVKPLEDMKRAGPRLRTVLEKMAGRKAIVDIACGPGSFALALAAADPERTVVGIDYSQQNIDAANAAAIELGVADQVTFICEPVWDYDTQAPSAWFAQFMADKAGSFDAAWCGEFIEHVAAHQALVDSVESLVVEGGTVMFSCPYGSLSELCPRDTPLHRGHVHHFRAADIAAVFGAKQDFVCLAAPWDGTSPRGSVCGNWILAWTNKSDCPTAARPLERRVLMRPLSRLTAGIIVNDVDAALDLSRCLNELWPVVDEIVLGDCGVSEPVKARILSEFPRKTRWVPVGKVHDLRGGFAEARNAVLKEASGEWFLWIDADERLVGGMDLNKYIAANRVFRGFAIRQQHLHLDGPMGTDTPIRLFRRGPDIQFYGCVHEQPQQGDCNGDILPSLQINDVELAHTGYLHEGVRRDKALKRNLPLLERDRVVFPDRTLGLVLAIRECANLALWAKERAGGRLNDESKAYESRVIALYEQHFLNPGHKYHALARPFYEQAVRDVDGAIEVELALAGAPGGLKEATSTPSRVWVRTPDHLRALLQWHLDEALKPLEHPVPLEVDPLPTSVQAVA